MKSESSLIGKEKKIGFVVLHYNNYATTIRCIESILNLEEQSRIKIVVVDNHSPNNSGYELQKKYLNNSHVEIVLLDRNYGFSRANNVGYTKLINSNPCEIVVITNNDIIFKQVNFVNLLEEAYKSRGFYIGGPDIYAIYKEEHQSPLAQHPRTREEIERWIQENEKKLKYVMLENILRKIWLRVNKTKLYYIYCKLKKKQIREQKNWKIKQDNIVLSGACLFFSEKFIELSEKPFEPETDFYHEEDILTARCLKEGWRISYIPEIHVDHLEGIATNEKNYFDKMKFRYTNFIKSGKVYLNYLNEGKENE